MTEAAASQNIGDVSVQALKLYADLSDEQAQKVINDFKKWEFPLRFTLNHYHQTRQIKALSFRTIRYPERLSFPMERRVTFRAAESSYLTPKKAEPSRTSKIIISVPTSQIITRAWQNNMLSNTSRLHQPRRSPTSRIQAHGLYRAIKTPLRSARGLTHKTPTAHCYAAIL